MFASLSLKTVGKHEDTIIPVFYTSSYLLTEEEADSMTQEEIVEYILYRNLDN